MNRQSISTNE